MKLTSLKTFLLLLLCSAPVVAQKHSDNWYQIEVFIFANTSQSAGINEHWPQNLGLAYPDQLIELQQSATPTGEASLSADGPQAYALLDDTQKQLTPHVRRLLHTGQHRVLFHQAWLQPLKDREQSVGILIRGGEQYDRHYELEGHLTFSVERYLHVNTDLWLSQFASTIGSDQMPWPVLPTPPSVIKAEQQMADELDLQPAYNHTFMSAEQRPLELLFDQKYAVERTVVMRQHRRMRSQELHYLDHPLMGVLVKVIPYKTPEPIDESPEVIEAGEIIPASE